MAPLTNAGEGSTNNGIGRKPHLALVRWLRHYNHERPHGSLGNQPPVSRLMPAL
ncbi:MAG: integrase core domain-containing protein [Gaiellales bacterium]